MLAKKDLQEALDDLDLLEIEGGESDTMRRWKWAARHARKGLEAFNMEVQNSREEKERREREEEEKRREEERARVEAERARAEEEAHALEVEARERERIAPRLAEEARELSRQARERRRQSDLPRQQYTPTWPEKSITGRVRYCFFCVLGYVKRADRCPRRFEHELWDHDTEEGYWYGPPRKPLEEDCSSFYNSEFYATFAWTVVLP